MKEYKIVGVKLPTSDYAKFVKLCEKMQMNQSEFATKLVYSGLELIEQEKPVMPNFIATTRFSLNYTSDQELS